MRVGPHGGMSGFIRGEGTPELTCLLSRLVPPCAVVWGTKKALTRCWHHSPGHPSLQSHALNKPIFFISDPGLGDSVIATRNGLRHLVTKDIYREVPNSTLHTAQICKPHRGHQLTTG